MILLKVRLDLVEPIKGELSGLLRESREFGHTMSVRQIMLPVLRHIILQVTTAHLDESIGFWVVDQFEPIQRETNTAISRAPTSARQPMAHQIPFAGDFENSVVFSGCGFLAKPAIVFRL